MRIEQSSGSADVAHKVKLHNLVTVEKVTPGKYVTLRFTHIFYPFAVKTLGI